MEQAAGVYGFACVLLCTSSMYAMYNCLSHALTIVSSVGIHILCCTRKFYWDVYALYSSGYAPQWKFKKKKNNFISFCQPTSLRLITCAKYGNHVQIFINSRQSLT